MIQTRLEVDRIISRWQSRLPQDRPHPLCTCCGNPISDDELFSIRDRYYDADCAEEMCREWVIDEPVECVGCDEMIEEEYYNVNGDTYCRNCFERYFNE